MKMTSATMVDDEEELHQALADDIISANGKEVLDNIYQKVLRKKLTERSEASIQVSEFTVNAEDPQCINEDEEAAEEPSTQPEHPGDTLTKEETERIQREVAFEKTSKEVSRWQSVVLQNQKAEQLVFPLNQEPSGPKRMEKVVAGWKAQTPLEQELFSLLHMNKQPLHDPVLTPTEEACLRAMSLEEAKIRRRTPKSQSSTVLL
ncbi:hypothetical protein J4Q44_G00121510 [Coregonus suidteri]|uniref:Uncharacterized protein n=1 Tax=Coregonus suidteri TaxID=861788 RepID=A0AAN8M3Z7_9TELE